MSTNERDFEDFKIKVDLIYQLHIVNVIKCPVLVLINTEP